MGSRRQFCSTSGTGYVLHSRGFLNSQRTTEFHWFSLSGRSRCERIHCQCIVQYQ